MAQGRRERHPAGPSRRAVLAGAGLLGARALTGCSPTTPPAPATGDALTPSLDDPLRLAYATASPRQFGDLYLPAGASALTALPVVVSVHGGGWKASSGLGSMEPICRDLAAQGVAVWNIEYRGAGSDGGWSATFQDVAAAVDAIATLPERTGADLNVSNVHITGYSAGGHLAAWVAARPVLDPAAPGANPRVRVRSCLPLAGLYDLVLAEHSGDSLVCRLLGGSPNAVPERYAQASPIENLPTGIPVICLHGANDRTVDVAQARTYVAAATAAGDPAQAVILPDASHRSWTDTRSLAWRVARLRILQQLRAT
jgi:acetyl esterase/lipase